MWNVEKIVSKGDYNHLGRLLGTSEVVHHLNGNKKDNRIENLEVMSGSTHAKHHAVVSLAGLYNFMGERIEWRKLYRGTS
jgi:hypothetical protein